MTFVRWNPWGELDAFHHDLDRFFSSRPRAATTNEGFPLATDVHESATGYELCIDLPGVALGDVDIEVHEGVLTITGQRHQQDSDGADAFRRRERRFGAFSRSFRLPKHVDESSIDASMTHGVLQLRLPKVAAVQPRKIEITA